MRAHRVAPIKLAATAHSGLKSLEISNHKDVFDRVAVVIQFQVYLAINLWSSAAVEHSLTSESRLLQEAESYHILYYVVGSVLS